MDFLVYLAGPVYRMSWEEASGWRRYATELLEPHNIHCLSPLRGKPYLVGMENLTDARQDEIRPLSTPKGIVSRDFNDVIRADVVLANFLGAKAPSIGTCMELGAAHVLQKPIVTVVEQETDHFHSMLIQVSNFVVPTLDQGIEIVKAILLPNP